MKIHIFYRHYNISGNDNKGRPSWFNFEQCFINLLSTIENKNINLHLVMDGNVESNFINQYKEKEFKCKLTHDVFFDEWFEKLLIWGNKLINDKFIYKIKEKNLKVIMNSKITMLLKMKIILYTGINF